MFFSWLGPYWHHSQFYCNNTNSDGICRSKQNMDGTPHLIFERAHLITCKVSLTQTFPKELGKETKHHWLPAGSLGVTCLTFLILLAVKFYLFQLCSTEHAKQLPIKFRTTNTSDIFFFRKYNTNVVSFTRAKLITEKFTAVGSSHPDLCIFLSLYLQSKGNLSSLDSDSPWHEKQNT